DYAGVYNIMEKIRRGSDRVDISKLETYDNDPVNKTGGYMFKIDRRDTGDIGFTAGGYVAGAGGFATTAYYYPNEMTLFAPQRDPQEQYLTSYINSFVTALNGPGFANPV